MAKQKKDLSLIVWAFGWLLAIATSLKKFAAELEVPFEAFERLGSAEGEASLKKIVALIRDEWAALQPKAIATAELAVDHYHVHVSYAALPSLADLKKIFLGGVSAIFDGRKFRRHASCISIDETAGERTFWTAVAPADILDDSEAIIAWGDKQGYRPATHQEAVEFAAAHPELQKKWWIVALGSFAQEDGYRYVAVLNADSDGRILGVNWFDLQWLAVNRFLFVRK